MKDLARAVSKSAAPLWQASQGGETGMESYPGAMSIVFFFIPAAVNGQNLACTRKADAILQAYAG